MATAEAAQVAAASDIFHPALPLDRIEISKTNPRKHVVQSELDELTESIRAHGVVSPIVVRPHPRAEEGWYELVFGERRFRAACAAELKTIPAIERAYDDKTVVEVQIIENVQREDVHELDEANGYQLLIDHHGYSAASIGQRIGKSKEYVYNRLKLAGLIPEVQKLFYARELTAGHAVQCARLPEVSQKVVLEKGLFEMVRHGNEKEDVVVSVRDLNAFIDEHIHSDLGAAIFDVKDPKLLPAAGACGDCPKRFGNVCADRACFNKKFNAFVKLKVDAGEWIAVKTEWDPQKKSPYWWNLKEVKKGSCDYVTTAICMDGRDRGKTKLVCLMTNICKVHYGPSPRYERPKLPAAEQLKNAQQSIAASTESKLRQNLYGEIAARVDTAPTVEKAFSKEAMLLVARLVYDRLDHKIRAEVTDELSLKKASYSRSASGDAMARYAETLDQVRLAAFIVRLALRATVSGWSGGVNAANPKQREQLIAIAKRHGVKVERVEEEVAQLRKEKLERAKRRIEGQAKVQTRTKSKTGGKKK